MKIFTDRENFIVEKFWIVSRISLLLGNDLRESKVFVVGYNRFNWWLYWAIYGKSEV